MEEEKKLRKIREEYEALLQEAAVRKERRSTPRLSGTIPVTLKEKTAEAHLFSLDVGLGGIRLVWDEPLKLGEHYDLAVALDATRTWVHLQAEVIWQKAQGKTYEIGMKFTSVEESEKRKLNAFLEEATYNIQAAVSASGLSGPDEEKRRFARVPRLFLALIETKEGGAEKLSGLIVDISLGGARLISSRRLEEDQVVVLHIELEENNVISVPSRIVWSNHVDALKKFQHGVEFVHAVEFKDYPDEVRSVLDTYIHYQNTMKELNLVQTLLEVMREKGKKSN